jgi:hypothetical protein
MCTALRVASQNRSTRRFKSSRPDGMGKFEYDVWRRKSTIANWLVIMIIWRLRFRLCFIRGKNAASSRRQTKKKEYE